MSTDAELLAARGPDYPKVADPKLVPASVLRGLRNVQEANPEVARMMAVLDHHLPTIITGLQAVVHARAGYRDMPEEEQDVALRAALSASHWVAKEIASGDGEELYDLPSVLDLMAQNRKLQDRKAVLGDLSIAEIREYLGARGFTVERKA